MKTLLELFIDGYIAALYFTDCGEPDQPPHGAELSPDARALCVADCTKFYTTHALLISAATGEYGYCTEYAGHDFWLTRNRHGVGFWDRGMIAPDIADALTNAARAAGEVCTFLEANGSISCA